MTTFLQATNEVLARLREASVASVTTSAYSTLIGHFVNDSKRQVEDAWNWDALSQTLTLTCVGGQSTYTLTGSGKKPKDSTVNNTTLLNKVRNVPLQSIIDKQQLTPGITGSPTEYAWNGNDGTDSKVELWPTPSGTDVLKFNLYVPQLILSVDSTVILVPSNAVVAGAYARAIVERGEDGGLSSGEAYGLFKSVLADEIAHESGRFIENEVWVAN